MSESQQILESLQAVNDELHAIGKDQQGYGYKFRGIDDVLNALNPLFKKHKIVTLRRNLHSERVVRQVEKIIQKYNKETKEQENVSTLKEYVEVFLQADYVFKSLKDGSEIISQGFGEGQDTSGGDKASSMATSNSYKYVIFEMFNIATKEQKDSDQITAEKKKASDFKTTNSETKKETTKRIRFKDAKPAGTL